MPKKTSTPVLSYTLLAIVLTVVLAGCNEKKEAAPKSQSATPMKVIKAETMNMPYWGEFIGQTSAVDTVDVRARVAGFLLEKKFEEGREVKKGDLLFVIDPKPFKEDLKQAQSQLEYNQALMQKAEKDYQRFSKLLDEGVVSRDEFESYQTSFNTYKAKVRETEAQVENARIQLGYTKIYSPIDGIIGRMQVDVGNLVGQNESTLLVTISTMDPIYVSFNVNESDFIRARKNSQTENADTKVIKMILADGSEYEHQGTFSMVDRAVNPQTGTLGIRVSFPNKEHTLRPGQYSKIRILIDEIKDAIAIPIRGIQDVQGMKFVYKVGDDGKIINQPVTTGVEFDNMIRIKEGLAVDDMVIVDGLRTVRPGMEIKPIVVPIKQDKGEPVPMNEGAAPAPADADSNKDG